MNREPDAGGPGHLTPETLAELEESVRLRLGGRVREFRRSIRDAGLVLRDEPGPTMRGNWLSNVSWTWTGADQVQ